MNPNRFFVTLVAGMLGVDGRRLADAYQRASQHYEIDNIMVAGGVGAAVTDGGEERLPLRTWIDKQRASGVKSVSVAVRDGSDDCADHMESEDPEQYVFAGFAGGLSMLLRVDTRSSRAVYTQGMMSGPRLRLTPALFLELVNAQSEPDFFLCRVLDEINHFHACNDRDEIDFHALPAHLLSSEGNYDWEFMGQQIFREIQVESFTHDKTFVMPRNFSDCVDEVRPVFAGFEPMVWLEMYDEDEVSAAALLRLVEAQDFGDRIWQIASDPHQLAEKLDEHDGLDDFPVIAATDWPRFLAELADQDVSLVSQVLVELVRLECESRGVQPCIPDGLADIFGPDDEERRRLYFRQRLQCDLGWKIRKTNDPGKLFVLDRVNPDVLLDAPMQVAPARQQFIEALTSARDFARRVDSPFHSTFGAARHLASKAVGAGSLDAAVLGALDSDLEPGLLRSVQRFTEVFAPFGWGVDRLLGLAAISVADVFGAAGSWNDQAFERADQLAFDEVSSALFTALNRYFEALVSVDA